MTIDESNDTTVELNAAAVRAHRHRQDFARRWSTIRGMLKQEESALLFNALQDKARGDREAAEGVVGPLHTPATWERVSDTLRAQAELAEAIADAVL
jgi:hypothetical protein